VLEHKNPGHYLETDILGRNPSKYDGGWNALRMPRTITVSESAADWRACSTACKQALYRTQGDPHYLIALRNAGDWQ
jgi:hypothetical protein